MKIAIVGMGVAGISVLREWTKEQKNNSCIEITVFNDEATFGTGVPYQKDNENLLMNVPAEFTTMIPEDDDDYLEWLRDTHGERNPRFEYYPRMLFGQYLKERMMGWLKESKAKIVKEKVDSIRVLSKDRYRIKSHSFQGEFDAVHLCIGNLPYKDPYDLKDHPRFIINPFPMTENLKDIPKAARVAVLGTGLTSIDIFRYFHFNRPDLKLDFYSRSGRFKSVSIYQEKVEFKYFTEKNRRDAKQLNNGWVPLDTYLEWFKKEIDYRNLVLKKDWMNQPFGAINNIAKELEGQEDLGIIQALLIDMNPFLTDLWMSLTETDKHRFLKDYYGIWGKLRSTFPAKSGKLLLSAWENQEIQIFDNLLDIKAQAQSFELLLKDEEPQKADYLINASGPETHVSLSMDKIPLLYQLLNERILQAENFGGVQVKTSDLSAISQKYGVLSSFKVHGHLISGIQFGNNSVDIISDTAQLAVQDIVHRKKN